MINRKLPSFIEKVQSRTNLMNYLVITAMMVCASITFVQVGYWFTADITGFQWGYIPFLAAVVSLEAIFTRPVARELEGREQILYHLAEWVTIAVLLKVIYYLVRGFGEILVDLPMWQENFITFFQGEYFFALIFLAAVWVISHVSADDIRIAQRRSRGYLLGYRKINEYPGYDPPGTGQPVFMDRRFPGFYGDRRSFKHYRGPSQHGLSGPGHQYHDIFRPGIGAL